MISRLVLATTLAGVVAGLAVAVLLASSRKVGRDLGERVRLRRERAVQPLLVRIVAGELPDGLDRLRPAESRALAAMAIAAAGPVRGTARDDLVALVERLGVVADARRDVRRGGPVRRARAAEVLGAVGDGRDVAVLAHLLHHRVPELRQVAARALGGLGRAEAVPLLLDALGGARPLPAGQVSMALWRIGTPAVEGLREALRHPDPTVRLVAAGLLGELVALRAVDDLIGMVRDDPDAEVRRRAAVALGRLAVPQAVEPLLACLPPDQPVELRDAATQALARIGSSEAVPALVGLLDGSDQLARRAAGALVQVGPAGRHALAAAVDARAAGADHAHHALVLARLHEAAARTSARQARARLRAGAAGSA